MTPFSICPTCSTHIVAEEPRCPFCDATRESGIGKRVLAAATIASTLAIAACGYGLGPRIPDAGLATRVDASHADASAYDAGAHDAPHGDASGDAH